MRKLLLLTVCGLPLLGCHGMQKLRYQNQRQDGHSRDVKYTVVNNTLSNIEIPVKYDVHADPIPAQLPKALEPYRKLFDEVGECSGECELSDKKLTLDVKFMKRGGERCFGLDENGKALLFLPPFWLLAPFYINTCTGVELINPNQSFSLNNPFAIPSRSIVITWRAKPDYIELDCDSKSCVARDKEGSIINQILITKTIKVNAEEIKQLIVEERKEEDTRKAEEDRKWRQKQRRQEKECPNLYRTLYLAQQGYYIDPIVGMKTAQRFDELDCGWWLNSRMY